MRRFQRPRRDPCVFVGRHRGITILLLYAFWFLITGWCSTPAYSFARHFIGEPWLWIAHLLMTISTAQLSDNGRSKAQVIWGEPISKPNGMTDAFPGHRPTDGHIFSSDDTGWVPCPRTNNLLQKTSISENGTEKNVKKKVIDDFMTITLWGKKGGKNKKLNCASFWFRPFLGFLGCFPWKRPIGRVPSGRHKKTITTESGVGSENQRRIDVTNRSKIWNKNPLSNTNFQKFLQNHTHSCERLYSSVQYGGCIPTWC